MDLIQECAQQHHWAVIDVRSSDGRKTYRVAVPPEDPQDAVCPCPSFAHRGYCRHLDVAREMICTWAEDSGPTQTKEQRLRQICPMCGGPTQVIAAENEED